MPRTQSSVLIHAPRETVMRLYRYAHWTQLFPRPFAAYAWFTLLPDKPSSRSIIGKALPDVLIDIGPDRIGLWEAKRHYDGWFENRFERVREGTRCIVAANIQLKGLARLLAPVLGPTFGIRS